MEDKMREIKTERKLREAFPMLHAPAHREAS
jgi:hypothetical protein